MDNLDRKILRELQSDCKQKLAMLSKKLNAPRTTIMHRIKKLEQERIIQGYKAVVDAKKIGNDTSAIVLLRTGSGFTARQIAQEIKKLPNVTQVYAVAGQFDLAFKIYVKNNDQLAELFMHPQKGLRLIKGIEHTETMIILDTLRKEGIIE